MGTQTNKNIKKTMGIVVSDLRHPLLLSYDGKGMMIAPRGKSLLLEKAKLGALPKRVVFIEQGGIND